MCVSILGEHQRETALRLAASRPDKLREVSWSPSPSGAPILTGSIAWLDCSVVAEHRAGDHDIVVARVHHLEPRPVTGPLVFHGGRYGGFTETA